MALNNPTIQGSVSESSKKDFANENDTMQEYRDERYVTISLVSNYSNYRKANMKVMGQRTEIIGSSLKSCRVLSSNAGEVAAYFPSLIGVSESNPDFLNKVKAYLSNIQFAVTNKDVKLNVSFIYKHKKDYETIKKEEDKINADYEKVDRANITLLEEALKKKIDAINRLESSKYQYGRPENIEEYLMYRHCLLYSEVAKDTAFINSNNRIRFYIKDETKEAELQKRLIKERSVAMQNFVELNGTTEKFNAVYIAIVNSKNENLAEALMKDSITKTNTVMNFVNESPDKFNKFVNDKNIILKGFIETLILNGELVRSEFNQQILLADGSFIGANINEAVAWFENPANKKVRENLENKLELLN